MQAGKAIYAILAANENITNLVATRIYPEIVAQNSALPFVYFEVTGVEPDSIKDGVAQIDEVRIEVSGVSETYNEVADLGEKIRGALDRIYGTYSGVNVESIEFNDVTIDVLDKPRRYIITCDFTARIIRGAFQIATGSPITGYLLDQLSNVNISDPLDRQVLAYDEASDSWVNDGAGSLVIPVKNTAPTGIASGTILKAISSQGDRIVVAAYSAGDDPKLLVGVANEDIPAGADGHCLTYGEIRALDTSAFTLGDILYPGSSGAFTTTEDTNNIALAIVTRVQQNTGRIFVRSWQPGKEAGGSSSLADLTDTTITSPSDGQLLEYDGVTRKWVNVPATIPTPPPSTTDDLTEGSSNLYFTDARVEANSAVTANSAKRSYPLADEQKLAGIAAGAEVNVNADWSAASGDAQILNKPALAAVATSGSYTDLTSKPTIPDELGQLSGDSDDITQGATNLFLTTAERSKLSGIAAGAEVNVNADWNSASGDSQILNKPSIPTSLDELGGNADDITEGQTNLFFTSAERTKLSGIETGAEVNFNTLVGVAFKDPGLSTQLITATATTISFDGEYYDTEGIIDTSANTISLAANSIYLVTADISIYNPDTTSGSRSEVEVRMLIGGNPPSGFLRRIYARDAPGGQGGSASFSFPYSTGATTPVLSWDVRRVDGATTNTRLYHCQFSYIKIWG